MRDILRAGADLDPHSFRRILDRGLDANGMTGMDVHLVPPLGHAIFKEQVSIAGSMELFWLKGCNPNSIVYQTGVGGLYSSVPIRVTALLAAVDTRNVSKVELLIRHGADVDSPARGPIKRTPLQRAEIGSIEMFELVVHNGAEVNARPLKGAALPPFSLQPSEGTS